jgi:hypothetical protein
MNLDIPFKQSVVTGLAPISTSSARTADYLNMALVLRVIIIATLTQAVGHATSLTLRQAKDNTGTSLKDLANNVPIWANEDVAAADGLTKQTDGVAYTVDDDVKNKKVIFQVEGDDMDVANGFTHLTVVSGASSQATDLINIEYIVESRTPGETLVD